MTDHSAHWTVKKQMQSSWSSLVILISTTILFIISINAIAIVIIINLFARWPPAKKQRQWFPVLHHQSQHNLDYRLDHCLDHHLVHCCLIVLIIVWVSIIKTLAIQRASVWFQSWAIDHQHYNSDHHASLNLVCSLASQGAEASNVLTMVPCPSPAAQCNTVKPSSSWNWYGLDRLSTNLVVIVFI